MSNQDPKVLADRFIQALQGCEHGTPPEAIEPMVELFSDEAKCGNLLIPVPYSGREGARTFWKDYRSSFREIKSHFTKIHLSSDGLITLEWTSEGIARSGRPFTYRGITLLEFNANGKIQRFQAYYDTAALIENMGGRFHHDISSAA